jgi:hypothetical protein
MCILYLQYFTLNLVKSLMTPKLQFLCFVSTKIVVSLLLKLFLPQEIHNKLSLERFGDFE